MTEQLQDTNGEPIHTIKIGEKSYESDSLTEIGTGLLTDIQKVDSILAHHQLELSVATLAKNTLIGKLEEEASKFKEIEVPDTTAANDA